MSQLIEKPKKVLAAGNKPKIIKEFIGRVNTGHETVSIARMDSPDGWTEPGQTPDFDEFTIVLGGELKVRTKDGEVQVTAGQAFHAERGQWVQYSTPFREGAAYISVCIPAWSKDLVNRDK